MADGTIDSLSIEIEASSARAATQINKLVAALQNLKTATSSNGLNLGNFKKELGKLGDTEVSKIEKLGKALEGLKGVKLDSKIGESMTKIAEACDLIEQKHIDKIVKFGQAMTSLQGVKTTGYDKLPASILNIAAAVDSITDDTIARLHRLTMALGRLRGVDLKGIGAVLNAQRRNNMGGGSGGQSGSRTPRGSGGGTGGGQSGQGVIGDQGGQEEQGRKSIQWTWSLKENLKLIGNSFRDIGKQISSHVNPYVKLFASVLIGAAKTAAKLATSILKIAANAAKGVWDKSAFGGLERSLGRIKNVISSFQRIAFYRAIRSAIKYVTDGLKEGVDNAYHYAREYGDATSYIADAYDNLASSNFKMSNQLGAAWATMIAYIEPIIIRIIDIVTRAADAITQFFAILSGKTTYLKASDYPKKWADSANGAAKAAKEWKNQLMGFDEINRLEEPSDGGGSGSGKSGLDYGQMFEESAKNKFFEEIRDAFENGEWARLGTLLGDKFNEIVDSIDWKGYGKKIGERWQATITVAYNFLKTADFKNLGKRISEFFNSALYEIDFEQAGRTWMRIRLALLDFFRGIVDGMDWSTLAIKLSDFVIGSLDELATWLSGLDPVKFVDALKDFFGNIKYKEIGEKLKEVLKNAFGFLGGVVGEFLPEDMPDSLKEGIVDAIKNADFAAIHNVLSYQLDKAVFGEDWADFFWKFGDYAGKDLVLGMMDGVDEQGRSSKYKNRVSEFIVGVLGLPSDEQWKQWGLDAIGWLASGFSDIKTQLDLVVAEPISKLVNEDIPATVQFFTELGPKAVSWIKEGFADFGTELYSIFVKPFHDMWDGLVEWWNGLSLGSFHIPHPVFEWTYTEATGALAKALEFVGLPASIPHLNISWYAQGGFPEDGLFMANHGELVGKFSNGRTAVANNEQITEGIADAVYEAFMTAFSQTSGSNGGDRPIIIALDGREIARTTTKYQNQFARANG